ncbi:hypothetical protein D3C75_1007770 [compost metagenome]
MGAGRPGSSAKPGVPGTQWLTQVRSALASCRGCSMCAGSATTQAALAGWASLLPRRRSARKAIVLRSAAISSPSGTGSSCGTLLVKPFWASTSKLAIFMAVLLAGMDT